MESKDWKLLRCIYDEMGQYAIEGEYCDLPDRFEEALAEDYGDIGWIIGKPIKHPGGITVKVILEGDKEILEYILRLVQADWNAERAARMNFISVAAANGFSGEEHLKNRIRNWWNRFWGKRD